MATQVIVGPLPVERDSEQARKRRRAWIAWLAVILAIFLCLFTCGQLSLLGAAPDTSGMASGSAMNADYAAWQGWSFGPLLPQIALEAIRDLGMGDPFQVATSTTCLLGNTCPTGTAVSPSSTPLGGPSATPTGGASPTPVAPTRTNTPVTTATNAPATSTPTITPTPTPLVYPVKLANPVNIPPGSTTVQFTIMVINYGNPTGAELTDVIDNLPSEMSLSGGCSPATCVPCGVNGVCWSGSWMIGQGSFRTFRFTANVAGTLAGDVLTNEVETVGGNFETAVNVRRVYVYTPTPTATPTEIPMANPDSADTNEDTPVTIDVLANDSNLRDLPLTLTSTDPPHGSVSFLNNPGFPATLRLVYAPDPNWSGTDVFTYRVTDNDGQFGTATVTVVVVPVNDVPVANDDAFNVNEDVLTPLNVLLNDTGLGDTPLSLDVLSGPTNGTAVVIGMPGTPATIRIRYQSFANYNGPDSLTYRVCDPGDQVSGDGTLFTLDDECDTATVNITVQPVNDAPVAAADNGYVVTEDQVLDTALLPGPPPPNPSVLTNDSDVDCIFPATDCNPTLAGVNPIVPWPAETFFNVGAWATNGSLLIRTNGSFVYTPRPNFFGTDTFPYWAYDGALYSPASATVRITVLNDPNDIPVAYPDSFPTLEDTPISMTVLANDTGVVDIPITMTITDPPDHAHPSFPPVIQYIAPGTIPPDIRILYTPAANWWGSDSLDYRICDPGIDGASGTLDDECDTATVSITVNRVWDPPFAADDGLYGMTEDQLTPLVMNVVANDLPGEPLPTAIDPTTVCIVGRPCPPAGLPYNITGGRITAIDPGTGEIRYEVWEDFNGPVTFSYTVADTAGVRSNAAVVSISVSPVNDVPDAVDDAAFTIVGASTVVPVLDNDLRIGDIPLSVLIEVQVPVQVPPIGTCTVEGSSVRFTPGPAFAGPTQCSYRVTDADGEFDVAVVTIFVNDPPVARDDTATTNEGFPVTIDVLKLAAPPGSPGKDSDSDQGLDLATVTITSCPGGALCVDNGDGTVTFTPAVGFHGISEFRYTVDDLFSPPATSNLARVRITVNSVNSNPIARDDTAYVQEDQDPGETINVLANDSDPDSPPDPLSLTITSFIDGGPLASTTAIDDNGTPADPSDDTLLYTPGLDVWGQETISYEICDLGADGLPASGDEACDSADVDITINGWPTAVNDTAITDEDVSVEIFPLTNDTDPPPTNPGNWRVTVVGTPGHGTAVLNGGLSVFYNPEPNYVGVDGFSYTMIDGDGGSSSATITVTVSEADDVPIANDDPGLGFPLQVLEGQTVSIDVLANDLGLRNEPLSVAITAGPTFSGCPSAGSADVLGIPPGLASSISIEYTAPSYNCTGVVTFDYTVTDTDLDSDSATVTIVVTSVNDPPVAVADSGSTLEEASTLIDVASNDTDEETAVVPATVAIATCPGGAVCVPNGDGTVTYTPAPNFFGTASFTYTIRDTDGASSAPGTVTMDVAPVNDPPIAADRSASTNQGVPVTITVAATDIDGSVDPSTATVVSGPANGAVINNGDGTFTYTPIVGPFLSDSFTYQVWDNDGAPSNVATVTIGINQPDLTVNKDAIPDSAAPGEEVQFFISIINNGPGTAFSVSVSDDLGDCFRWVGSPSFGSLGDLDQGEARVLAPRAQVRAAPSPGCDNTNRAVVTAANASTSDDTVTVSILTPPTMLFSMMMPVELTPLGSPTPTETVEPALTPTTDPADPTPTVEAEISETPTPMTPEESPSASVAPPTAEGTATAEETPVETSAPTDPPTEAPPTPEPVVVPTEEATPAPEPSEPPAPATEPPAPVPEPPTEPPAGEEPPVVPPGGGGEPPAEPLVGEEAPAMPPGGGEEPPSESMAAVLTNVRWDRLSRRPLWGRADGMYAASDSGWLLRYLFGLFAPPGAPTVSPTPMPGP